MRQAGRYQASYRAVRQKVGFLELCRSPELIAQVTAAPIDEFGLDAAILFSDILIALPAMGLDLSFEKGEKGKGDGGGAFIIENQAAKAKYLSKALIELWAKADAHTPKGDVGPVDFDPVTNSQEPDVKSFKVVAEKLDADKAVIAVTITGRTARAKPSDDIVRYNFVRDDSKWKIDDISGTIDGEAWSIRDILKESLKELA